MSAPVLMVKRGRRYSRADKVEVLNAAAAYQVQDLARGPALTSPALARDFLVATLGPRDAESFCAIWLDSRHRVLGFDVLFTGTVDKASVHPREVVRTCLEREASAVILAHNHPSGAVEPSQADELITRRLKEALALIDVRLLDHVIVGRGTGTYSFFASGVAVSREEKLQARYGRAVAALKRAESRLVRTFNAWQKAKAHLRASERLLEQDPPPRGEEVPFIDDPLP